MGATKLLRLACIGPLLAAGVALADEPDPARNVSGSAGVVFTTEYVSRGLVLENQGAIAQPTGELDFKIYSGDGAIQKVTLLGGIWNSLHSEHTDQQGDSGIGSTTDIWYELDWYAGVSVDFLKNWNLTTKYWEFTSPNDGFGTSKNVEFTLSFKDSGMYGNDWFGLSPYAIVFIETDGKAGNGKDEGVYFELGISPNLPSFGSKDYPISVAFPIKVGLGASDFYGDAEKGGKNETFGYASVGVVASMPLKFLSDAGFGSWTWSVGGTYYYLGDALDDFNDPNVRSKSSSDWVAFTGLSVAF